MARQDVAVVEKLILDIAGKKVELTKEQAQALHAALGELFGVKVVEKVVTVPVPAPSIPPAKPYFPDEDAWPTPKPFPRRWNEVWCQSHEGNTAVLSCR